MEAEGKGGKTTFRIGKCTERWEGEATVAGWIGKDAQVTLPAYFPQ